MFVNVHSQMQFNLLENGFRNVEQTKTNYKCIA